MTNLLKSQKGAAPVLVLVAVIGLVAFLGISSTFRFNDKFWSRLFPVPDSQAAGSYNTQFSTYLGGSDEDQIRDVDTDSAGNVYVVGGTASSNFPTTDGSTFHTGTCNDAGTFPRYDVFIVKYSPTGVRLGSTLLGGSCYERAYAGEIFRDITANKTYLYVAGRAGQGFPTTAGVLQPSFNGITEGGYGNMNAFMAKYDVSGNQPALVWSTYIGTGKMNRDIDVDSLGNAYVFSSYNPSLFAPGTSSPKPPNASNTPWFSTAFANAFIKTPAGQSDAVIYKVSPDGKNVLAATFFGGSGGDFDTGSIRIDSANNVVIASGTTTSNLPTTANAYQRTFGGTADMFIAKLDSNLTTLQYLTYFGGSGNEFSETHSLQIDSSGYIVSSATTSSSNLFPTGWVGYDTSYNGGNGNPCPSGGNYLGDGYVAKFDLTKSGAAQLVAGTYLGGAAGDGFEGTGVDSTGNVYFSGASGGATNPAFPTTTGATANTNQCKIVAGKLSADLKTLEFADLIGATGSSNFGRTAIADSNGNFYVAGHVNGGGVTLVNPAQATYAGNTTIGDGFLAKFIPAAAPPPTIPPTPTPTPSPTPTPAPKLGDITGPSGVPDNKVNIFDFNQLLADFGCNSGACLRSDVEKSGLSTNKVDIFDFNTLLANFGK